MAVLAAAWKQPTKANFLSRTLYKAAIVAASAGLCLPIMPNEALAFGPVDVALTMNGYKPVELCNGKKPIMPGQKAMEGLFPVCIEVEAEVVNPKNEPLTDVSVYGFIKDDQGNSVLPNNPDFKSDGGQYAMIKTIPPGKSTQKFQFVAAVSTNPKDTPLPVLTFFKTKVISFPGGDKFQPLGECEIDPRADGCDGEGGDE